jgi:FHA domain
VSTAEGTAGSIAEPSLAPVPTPTAPPRRLAQVDVLDSNGRWLRSASVHQWPLHIGRGLDQDLVLDDPFVAPHHASLWLDSAGQLQLQVGQTVNGVAVQGRTPGAVTHAAGSQVALPVRAQHGPTSLHIGQTQLLLRLPGTAMAPERVLPRSSRLGTLALVAIGAALLLLGLLRQWLDLDPGADTTTWLPGLFALPAGVLGWCAAWALVSKLFQGRFDLTAHLRIALPWLLTSEVLTLLLPQLAAAAGWPWLWRLAAPVQVVLTTAVVHQHLAYVLPQHIRRVTGAVLAAVLVGSAITLAYVHRSTDRFSRPAYMSTLPLPALHVTPSGASASPTSLVQDLEPLAARLQKRVAKARSENAGVGEDGPD